MRIKRFKAADMRQAIAMVRDELGAEAVILSNRSTADGVEVSAAAESEPADAQQFAAPPEAAPPAPVSIADGATVSLESVHDELNDLRMLLENQLSGLAFGDFGRRHPGRAALMRRLDDLGLSQTVARDLAQSIPDSMSSRDGWQRVMAVLRNQIKATAGDLLDEGGVVALLGPTGVGKTTTIAKLAARFTLRHGAAHVAMITTDSYRVGAHEQIRNFGRLMDIPVRIANDREELREAVDFFRDRRLVLIDTAGMSQRDIRLSQQVSLLRGGSPLLQIYLVLSATSQWLNLEESIKAFGPSVIDGCVITKTDESTSLGPVLSVLARHRLPVAFISHGQRVPEDLRPGRPRQLIADAVELANQRKQLVQTEDGASAGWFGDIGR